MTKKFLFTTAIALVTLIITYTQANAEAQIIIDPVTKTITITGITLNTGIQTTGTIQTGITNTGVQATGTNTIQTGLNTTGTEFERALSWMYVNGLTKYDNQTDYRMYDPLTREEAAKMFSEAYNVLGYTKEIKNTNCNFNDKGIFNPELVPFIQNVCQRGIIKGFNNNYMAQKELTRPEAMAILIRMFEGKVSFEDQHPRWSDYYIKGKALGLTTLSNNNFEKEISRYEIALYIYRLQTIANDSSLKLQSQLTLQNLTGIAQTGSTTPQTGTEPSSELAQKFSAIANSISVENDPELQEAIRWMHDNGLTSFSTIGEYRPFEVLTREQSAKIFDVFANVFNFSQEKLIGTLPIECQFKDLTKADPTLTTHIQNVCKMEILKGGNQLFDPKTILTKGQFITALIRLVEGKKLDETKDPRWTAYYQKALDMGIVGPADAITFDSPITRYEVALFLYRFRVKFQLINNLNTNTLENMIFNTVPGTIQTTGGLLSGEIPEAFKSDIFIDTNLLQNANFELGYIEIFNTKYKVIKSSTETYFSKNFVRYGDVYDISTDQKIGTINFIVSNRIILEGTARIEEKIYTITQAPNTTAYYQIKKN
ncbi:MAG: hypothetical protein PHR61_03610 [Candidatus Absconditabacteria bacterium]|nr:hypothetical protein [Candidatus Absconditabacteria bacterium]